MIAYYTQICNEVVHKESTQFVIGQYLHQIFTNF